MSYVHRFAGRLIRSPFAARPQLVANGTSAIATLNDFAALSQLRRLDPSVPFLVTCREKYDLLEKVVRHAFDTLAQLDICLLTASMPGTVPLPPRLLQSDIFLCDTLDQERPRLVREGRTFLTIDESIPRHLLEYGDNGIQIEWHAAARSDEVFDRFINHLGTLGVEAI